MTVPVPGQDPWGEDLNDHLASLEARLPKDYPFYFQDGTLGEWCRDDGVLLSDTTWDGTFAIVDASDTLPTYPEAIHLGPAGYALEITENTFDAFTDDENLYGYICSPLFPAKVGDIVQSRLIISSVGVDGVNDRHAVLYPPVMTLCYDVDDPSPDDWYLMDYPSNPSTATYSKNAPYERSTALMELYNRGSYSVPGNVVINHTATRMARMEWCLMGLSHIYETQPKLPFRLRIGGCLVTVTTPGGWTPPSPSPAARAAARTERPPRPPMPPWSNETVEPSEPQPEYVFNSYPWKFSSSAPPAAAGELRLNDADPALATQIDVRKIDGDGADRTHVFTQLTVGDQIRINDWDDASIIHRYTMAAPLTIGETNVTIPVTWDSGNGMLPTTGPAKINVALLVSLDL